MKVQLIDVLMTIDTATRVDMGQVTINSATVKNIIDAAFIKETGHPADHEDNYTGNDPYDAELVKTVDGWLVVGHSDGSTLVTHAILLEE